MAFSTPHKGMLNASPAFAEWVLPGSFLLLSFVSYAYNSFVYIFIMVAQRNTNLSIHPKNLRMASNSSFSFFPTSGRRFHGIKIEKLSLLQNYFNAFFWLLAFRLLLLAALRERHFFHVKPKPSPTCLTLQWVGCGEPVQINTRSKTTFPHWENSKIFPWKYQI